MRIIQLCEAVHYGDGVGNDILRKADLFRELGYSCEIYAKEIDQCLSEEAHPVAELAIHPGDILLHHYAGYSDMVDWVRDLPCVKVLIYHNITPPELVQGEIRSACELGLRQLSQLRGQYDYYAGVSAYNVADLAKYELAASYDVLPIPIDLPAIDLEFLRKSKRCNVEGVVFLFVGRIARNKMQDALLRVFYQYWDLYDKNAKLILVGDTEADPTYYQEICALLDTLPCKRNVCLTGKVSDWELDQAYEKADIYVSLSRHEGFGIPLLEAMHYQLPVFAFRSAAVEETLGSAGVLIDTNDPKETAKILRGVITDRVHCEEIIQWQNERIQQFRPEAVRRKMQELVNKWGADILKTAEERAVYHRLSIARSEPKLEEELQAAVPPQSEPFVRSEAENQLVQDADIQQMRDLAENYAYRPIYSCRKYIGKFIVFGKRVVRKLLKWYLEPVCFQQTEFNLAVVGTVSKLNEGHKQTAQRLRDEQTQVAQRLRDEQTQVAQQLRDEQTQTAQQLRDEQTQAAQQLRDEQTQAAQQLRDEQAQTAQQLRDEQMQAAQQLRDEQTKIEQLCTSVMQRDSYLAEQIQRMQSYLDRLDASGIPIFQPEQGIRWGDNKMSQDGTDTIVSSITSLMGIPLDQVYYLDLGANHAIELSSTYFFYKNGAHGVLVEANPALIPELRVFRSGDTVVDCAVTARSGEKMPFYVVSDGDGLSSTSEAWVQDCIVQSRDLGRIEKIQVDTITVNEILEHYCEQTPVFVDLDIEGTELEILKTFNFQKYRPLVFAIEMIPFQKDKLVFDKKNLEIVTLMEQNGYAEYAFTGINSIFVDQNRLEAMQ